MTRLSPEERRRAQLNAMFLGFYWPTEEHQAVLERLIAYFIKNGEEAVADAVRYGLELVLVEESVTGMSVTREDGSSIPGVQVGLFDVRYPEGHHKQ